MGYSVVKDQTGGISPLVEACGSERFPPNPLRALTRGAPLPHSGQSRFLIRRGEYRPSSKLAGRSASPRTPFAPSLAGPHCPTPVSRVFSSVARGVSRERNEWRIPGSNRRPPGCKPGALPAELIPRVDSHRDILPWRLIVLPHPPGGLAAAPWIAKRYAPTVVWVRNCSR